MTGLPRYRNRRQYHDKSTIGETIAVLQIAPILVLIAVTLIYAANAIAMSF